MVEAVMLWNEPNNLSHWDFKADPDWKKFAEMITTASKAIRRECPGLPIALDGNHWKIQDWPKKIDEIRAVTGKPVWVSEAGVSSFGAEEVQVFGIKRTAELL